MSSESHTVKAVFTFKDNESKDKFVEFCNGENGLSVTRAWEGCQSIECYESSENSLQVVIWQKWNSKENHESYVKHRHEDGSFTFLHELIASPPEIVPLRPVLFKTDKEQVEDVLRDMCDKDHNVGMKHMHDDCVFIRPSGNPLTKEGWKKMMENDDVVVESSKLVSVNKLELCGDTAYVCYTSHGCFSYKGTKNDDVAVLTCVMRRVNGRWMVMMGQRSTGRLPSEQAPQF